MGANKKLGPQTQAWATQWCTQPMDSQNSTSAAMFNPSTISMCFLWFLRQTPKHRLYGEERKKRILQSLKSSYSKQLESTSTVCIAFKHLDSEEESPKSNYERIKNLIPSQLQPFLLLLKTVETVCTALGVHEIFRDRRHNLVLQRGRIIGWQKESRWRLSGLESDALAPVSSTIFACDSPLFRCCFDSTSTLSRRS